MMWGIRSACLTKPPLASVTFSLFLDTYVKSH
jgi:hypothetical protein